MERIKIEGSSNIAEVGYDKATETLQIKFNNGGIYDYKPVTLVTFINLKNAESKGKFVVENIVRNKEITYKKMG